MTAYIVLTTLKPATLNEWLNSNGERGWELDKLTTGDVGGYSYIIAVMKKVINGTA